MRDMEPDQNNTSRIFLACGAIAGFLAVGFGAFGAHALQSHLSADRLNIFKTGVQYQAIHALALLFIALLMEKRASRSLLTWIGGLFTFGIVIFSGSLYALALSDKRILGAVTPLGGLCFLAGWALLTLFALKPSRE